MFPFFGIFIVSDMSDGMNLNPQWPQSQTARDDRVDRAGRSPLLGLPVLAALK
jgi:hypothetical protein